MQQISSNYKNEIKQPSRHFECRVTIGKNIYTNESIVDIILDYPQAIDGFSIGNTTSQSLDLTLLNTGEEIYSTNQIKVEIGLQVGSDFEYILMGYYNVDEVSKNDYTIKFTAFDNMMKFETPYFSSLGDKPTLQQVVNELATITGISFVGSIPSYTVTKLDGYTCREVLSYVASLCGGNALITRDGKFTIKTLQVVDCSVTTETHFGLTTEEVPYKLGKITCVVDSEVELSKGATGIDSMELSFENPWMTESILNTLYQQLNGFSYLGFQTKWQGDLALDPYDLILIQDKKGTSHRVPILNQKFTYVGGLTSEIAAKGESKNKNSFSSSGPTANKTNRLVTEQAIIKEALINKASIQDLEAVSIRTQTLEATTAKIQDAIIDVAHISDLNAVNAKIESLQATDVTIQNAIINKADISELNAAVANINILNADLGVIKHLVNGNLSSENIQAGGITSDKLTIANGFIKNAMIDSLNANKITAGQINTALVRVSSASGNLVINDNTIQIRDANRVRVQIGKDASNDYSMSVWDSNGKLMFDARGLKVDAIKDSIIRNDMISAEANIDGTKLNISSVVSSINRGSSTLKASKVQFDGIAQTLEVAFNALKTQADATETQTESNTTAINVAHGKISTLIQDTTIVKDGVETKLKDEYSRLEQTVSGLNSTIGKQQTIIDDHSGKITSTNSELSTLKQSVNGLSASVSSAQATINSHTTLINQKADLTTVNEKVNGIQVGGRNYYLNSASFSMNPNNTGTGTTVLRTDESDKYYRATPATGKAVSLFKGITKSSSFKPNGTDNYIISLMVRSQKEATITLYDDANGGTRTNTVLKAGVWTRISTKPQPITALRNMILFSSVIDSYLDYKMAQLECGTISSTWVSAPEDVQASIDTKANSVDVYTKTEVYTKSQTDSAINIAKDAINLGVSQTYETKANVTTQISSTLNSAKSYADTKKSEAISSSSSDATTKANNALNSAKSYADTKKNEAITSANNTLNTTIANYYTKTQTDSQINVAKNAITQSVSSTYATKTDVTSSINGVNSSISNLQNRMNSAEQKITDSAIVSTVTNSSSWQTQTSNLNSALNKLSINEQTKMNGLELLPQGYLTNDSKGYSADYNLALWRNNRIEVTGREWIRTDFIKLDRTKPLYWYINVSNSSNNLFYFGIERFDKNKTTINGAQNNATHYVVHGTNLNGEWEGYWQETDTSTAYIRLRILCDWNNTGIATTIIKSIKWKQLGASITNDLAIRMSSAESKITDSSITNTVKQNFYTKTETDGKVTTVQNNMQSSITQLSNQIATKVDVNGVLSTIQQNPSSIQIGFNKISDALTIASDGMIGKASNGNKYFQWGNNGITMYNPANGTHQWGKVAAINNNFTVASNGNSGGLSLGHHVNEVYVEDIYCSSAGVVHVQRQMNHNGILYNNYGHIIIRQSGQGGWEITGRSDSQSIKPGGANQGAIGSSGQYINQSWIVNRYNPSSLEFKHVSHYIDESECIKLISEVQPARYFYKEFDDDGNDITSFVSRNSQLGLIYEDVRECTGRDLLTNEEDKAINDYNMSAVLWGATRNINRRLNDLEYENMLLRERVEQLEQLVN